MESDRSNGPHRALHNVDVLREIFCHFRLDDDFTIPSDDPKYLAQCACVCKAFSEHALDAPWSKLDKLLPLLNVLVTSFAPVEENDGNLPYNLLRAIPKVEFLRLRHYAPRRVRVLSFNFENEHISPSVFHMLAYLSQGTLLFSSISTLTWNQVHPLGMEMPLFMSPSLMKLKIIARDRDSSHKVRDPAFNLLVSPLSILTPTLQSLTIWAGAEQSLPVHDLAQLQSLRALHIYSKVSTQSVVDYLQEWKT
ncbi:hypothetical protein BKA93DRAFT_857721 [Sparassis latifolia]